MFSLNKSALRSPWKRSHPASEADSQTSLLPQARGQEGGGGGDVGKMGSEEPEGSRDVTPIKLLANQVIT